MRKNSGNFHQLKLPIKTRLLRIKLTRSILKDFEILCIKMIQNKLLKIVIYRLKKKMIKKVLIKYCI